MLITFNFSYLESFFVVFYLSFNFILAPGASAHDPRLHSMLVLARAVAKATATTPARARRKVVGKDKTRTKVEEEEALIASQKRTTRTRTRTEATPNSIQGGTSSPLEGSLDLPHACRLRPSESKGPSVSMKVVMTAKPRKEAVS